MSEELLGLLGDLLQQGSGDVVGIVGGGKLDRAPVLLLQDCQRVDAVRRVEQLARHERDAEAASIALHD